MGSHGFWSLRASSFLGDKVPDFENLLPTFSDDGVVVSRTLGVFILLGVLTGSIADVLAVRAEIEAIVCRRHSSRIITRAEAEGKRMLTAGNLCQCMHLGSFGLSIMLHLVCDRIPRPRCTSDAPRCLGFPDSSCLKIFVAPSLFTRGVRYVMTLTHPRVARRLVIAQGSLQICNMPACRKMTVSSHRQAGNVNHCYQRQEPVGYFG